MTTIGLLSVKSTFFDFQDGLYTSAATGGSTSTLVDSGLIGYTSETWPTKIVGTQIRITSGSASGDLRMVGKFDPSEGTIYPNRNFSAAVASTDTYELWSPSINGGTPLTTLFNTIQRGLRPLTDTQVTVVTGQNQYAIVGTAHTKRDIREVYIRQLDPSGLAPHTIRTLIPGLEWTAHNRGGASTAITTTLDLRQSRTLNSAVEELWVRATSSFTTLTSDTSSFDDKYRDWLAWEAVLELCRRKLSLTTADQPRWSALKVRASDEVAVWRAMFIPREPIEISLDWF